MITQTLNVESVHRSTAYLLNKKARRKKARRFWFMVTTLWIVALVVAGIMVFL